MIKKQFKRYIVVGGSAYLFEMSVLYILHKIIGLSPVRSVAISFWAGLVLSFVLQKFVAFKNHDRRSHIMAFQLAVFGLLILWNYLFTLVLVRLLDKDFSVFIIRTFAVAVTSIWNYFIYKRIFKKNSELGPLND